MSEVVQMWWLRLKTETEELETLANHLLSQARHLWRQLTVDIQHWQHSLKIMNSLQSQTNYDLIYHQRQVLVLLTSLDTLIGLDT